jgi:hypothetical protein
MGQDHTPLGEWVLTVRAADNPAMTLPGLYRIGLDGKVVLDLAGNPIPDPGGVPVFGP